jgi:hypothetical protein
MHQNYTSNYKCIRMICCDRYCSNSWEEWVDIYHF